MECIVLLVYMATFTMAFYGPNSHVLGSVGNNYWHYQKMMDLQSLMISAVEFLAIDLIGCLITSILLWKFCDINEISDFRIVILPDWNMDYQFLVILVFYQSLDAGW